MDRAVLRSQAPALSTESSRPSSPEIPPGAVVLSTNSEGQEGSGDGDGDGDCRGDIEGDGEADGSVTRPQGAYFAAPSTSFAVLALCFSSCVVSCPHTPSQVTVLDVLQHTVASARGQQIPYVDAWVFIVPFNARTLPSGVCLPLRSTQARDAPSSGRGCEVLLVGAAREEDVGRKSYAYGAHQVRSALASRLPARS